MNATKNSLGRGLGALIENAGEETLSYNSTNEIEIDKIEVNPFQPRKQFDDELLYELSESIKKLGIIQPITVRKKDADTYQLITGERRYRASKLAGLKKIPAYIREADDQGMLEMALVENIQREELNPIEISISYQRLVEECNLTQEILSERVGKKRSTVANYLRLLKLPAEIQLGLRNRKISMGHARALINIEEAETQLLIYERILKYDFSVRKVEEVARELKPEHREIKQKKLFNDPEEYNQLKTHLSKFFQTSVDFKRNKKGAGKIVISFNSDDDLERIVEVLDKLNN